MMGGGGGGMMGGQGNYNPSGKPIGIDQAAEAARNYVRDYDSRLVVTEVMEFAWNYYAEVEEEASGIHAMELLVDKSSGGVYPEQGPNMMWNTKYSMMSGMMGGRNQSGPSFVAMPVAPEQARALAQQFLAVNAPGLTVADADL